MRAACLPGAPATESWASPAAPCTGAGEAAGSWGLCQSQVLVRVITMFRTSNVLCAYIQRNGKQIQTKSLKRMGPSPLSVPGAKFLWRSRSME